MFGASGLALGLARKVTSEGRYANYQSVGGNCSLNTSIKKFGTASLNFDSNGDYMTANDQYDASGSFANHSNFVISGDFTIEAWIYPRNYTADMSIITNLTNDSSITNNQFQIWYTYSGPTAGTIDWRLGSTTWNTGTTVAVDQWHHIALVRSSGTTKMYVNGTHDGNTSTATSDIGTSTFDKFYFGIIQATNNNEFYQNMDEIRVSTSARYTSNFTPQTSEHVNDTDTVLLLHCNGTNGSTTITDDNS
jgi:hypothetical protein